MTIYEKIISLLCDGDNQNKHAWRGVTIATIEMLYYNEDTK